MTSQPGVQISLLLFHISLYRFCNFPARLCIDSSDYYFQTIASSNSQGLPIGKRQTGIHADRDQFPYICSFQSGPLFYPIVQSDTVKGISIDCSQALRSAFIFSLNIVNQFLLCNIHRI